MDYKRNNPEKVRKPKNDQFVLKDIRMTNQEFYLSVKKALTAMENTSGDDSDGEASENQSFMVIEGPEKYDFLTLVAMEESNGEDHVSKSDT